MKTYKIYIYMCIYQMNGTTMRQKDESCFNIRAVSFYDQC